MRHFAASIGLVGLLAVLLPHTSAAQSGPTAASPGMSHVPLSKVMLYSSGVAYFQHDGTIQGQSQVNLRFTIDQINDVLKSLVVQDAGGGRISTVSYGSRDPIMKTLAGFGINLTANPTLGQILNQMRGERIEVATPNLVTGTIVGVEKQEQALHDEGRHRPISVEHLTLLTDEGLRSFPLAQTHRIQLLNPQLNAELQQALAVLASGHDAQKRTVSIRFDGEGTRPVRLAYLTEAPVWKTSYRLILDDAYPPFLQGWAIIENSTETDWENVRLSLVSGRPISFVMDLYQPLYATRPVVTPELHASLQPRVHGDTLDEPRKEAKLAEREERRVEMNKSSRSAAGFGLRQPAADAIAPSAPMSLNPQQGVLAAAQGQDAGEFFEYAMTAPVSVARHTAAMLPIVNHAVEGRRVSIYNESTHAKYPLSGFRLTNSTPLYLTQGPVTVFDAHAYAGDARIEDLAPGQDRLLSYALDLKTEVEPKAEAARQDLVSVSLRKGVLIATHKMTDERLYRVKNRDEKSKTVLIEHPYRPDRELVEPSGPTERTRDVYRFSVSAEAGQTATLRVREEQPVRQTIQLIDSGSDAIAYFLQAKQVSSTIKEALQRAVTLRDRLSHTADRRAGVEQRIKEIGQEQARIRENMARLAQNSELYHRYVKKFDQQETEIERLRKDVETLKATEEEQKRELNDYVLGLDLS